MGISREQALDCFASDDLIGMGMEADAVRRRLHPEGVISYGVASQIRYRSDMRALGQAVTEAIDSGATTIRITAIPVGELGLDGVEQLLRTAGSQHPELWIEALSAPEILLLAANAGLTLRDLLICLRAAGLSAICGEGACLAGGVGLGSCSIADWARVHREAHAAGMRTRAVMTFGAGESFDQRIEFLEAVSSLQQQTGGIASFAAVAAEPPNGRQLDGVTAVERLKTLAVARMFLQHVDNIEAGSAATTLKVLQTELRFGANDAGQASPDGAGEEDMRRIIRDAGFRPAQRDAAFRAMYLA